VTSLEVEQRVWFRGRAMDYKQRKGETLQQYRERLNREFAERFPKLATLSLPGPYDEKDYVFFETVLGESVRRD
jgi:hypothetical protein